MSDPNGKPVGWIATGPHGRVLHFAVADGWQVDTVLFEPEQAPAVAREAVCQCEVCQSELKAGLWQNVAAPPAEQAPTLEQLVSAAHKAGARVSIAVQPREGDAEQAPDVVKDALSKALIAMQLERWHWNSDVSSDPKREAHDAVRSALRAMQEATAKGASNGE